MSFRSDKQRRWAFSKDGLKALQHKADNKSIESKINPTSKMKSIKEIKTVVHTQKQKHTAIKHTVKHTKKK
jgi:hypothetical protein